MVKKRGSRVSKRSFYARIKRPSVISPSLLAEYFSRVNQERVQTIGRQLSKYLKINLPGAIDRRKGLGDYRTNPYVLMTCASTMRLPMKDLAAFLFNSKLYAGLETSFGKSIESELFDFYPSARSHWENPAEKIKEAEQLSGVPAEERARRRVTSIWREVDKSYVSGGCRFLLSIKSGPNCINDTQVEAMRSAIINNHEVWFRETKQTYPDVDNLDIVIGITYGTEMTTNNKENQILVKLMEGGFVETEDKAGIVASREIPQIRVYRLVGRDFWAFVGNPNNPGERGHVFLEVLLSLLTALRIGPVAASMEELVNRKIIELSDAIRRLTLPRKSLPEWIKSEYDENELLWLVSAMNVFFDEGL